MKPYVIDAKTEKPVDMTPELQAFVDMYVEDHASRSKVPLRGWHPVPNHVAGDDVVCFIVFSE